MFQSMVSFLNTLAKKAVASFLAVSSIALSAGTPSTSAAPSAERMNPVRAANCLELQGAVARTFGPLSSALFSFGSLAGGSATPAARARTNAANMMDASLGKVVFSVYA